MARRAQEFEQEALPHARSLLRFALRLTGDRPAAEDLVQDAFLGAWRNFHQFQPGTNLRAWLFRIMLNQFYGQCRKARASGSRVDLTPDLPVTTDSAANSVELLHAFERLAEDHRTALLLAVVEGFTCREIADILDVPIGTVMSRLSRARDSLRELLSPRQKVLR